MRTGEYFHYTTTQAFLNIVSTGKIWLSDVRDLNDREEAIFSKLLITKAAADLNFQEWLDKLAFAGIPRIDIEVFHEKFRVFLNGRIGLEFEADANGYSPFVFCLSEEGDSLAQWRGYGDQEICIGFSARRLRERFSLSSLNTSFGKVEYFDPDANNEQIRLDIQQMLDNYVARALNQTSASPFTPDLVLNSTNLNRPLLMKHHGFSTEKEWRIIRRVHASGLPSGDGFFFRSSKSVPVPTISESIDIAVDMTSVRFGPGTDERLVANFRRLLTSGYPRQIQWNIACSSIPYRV